MVEVELQEITGLYFIVSESTGVEYTNQCGGYSCCQNSMEGFLVPFEYSEKLEERLYSYFYSEPKYKGNCYSGIDEVDALFIDKLLNHDQEKWITVDRSRLKDCKEAWIYLKLEEGFECFPFCYNSNPEASIVLVWENSD